MSKSGETGPGGERQYDDLDVHGHPFASGGYEIAQADDFWHTRHMMLGYFQKSSARAIS